MPTGTGKSGVIALAARAALDRGDALLLSPRKALVTQLAADVEGRFWSNMGTDAPSAGPIQRLLPSTAERLLDRHRFPD